MTRPREPGPRPWSGISRFTVRRPVEIDVSEGAGRRGLGSLRVPTEASNLPAIRLHESCGGWQPHPDDLLWELSDERAL